MPKRKAVNMFKIALVATLSLFAVVSPVSGSYYDTPDECTKDLVDVLASRPRFSTLVSAVQTAGLASALKNGGPFTIFAPTNAAFTTSLGQQGLNTLLSDTDALEAVLLYHVLPVNLESSAVTEVSYETLEGSDIEFSFVNHDVVVNDLAEIITFDICGSNGLIHAIDRVLVPPGIPLGFTPPVQCTGKGKGKGYNGSGNDCAEVQPFCTGKGKGKGYSGSDCVPVAPPAIPPCDGKGKGKGYSGSGADCVSVPRPCAGKGKGKGFSGSGTDCFEVPPFCTGKGKGKGYGTTDGPCTPVPPLCTGKGKGKGFRFDGDCTPVAPSPTSAPVTPPTKAPTRLPTRAPVPAPTPAPVTPPTCAPEGDACDNSVGEYCCDGFFCVDFTCTKPCVNEGSSCMVNDSDCCDGLDCEDTDGGNPNFGTCVVPCSGEGSSCMVGGSDCCDGLDCYDTDGGNPTIGTCEIPPTMAPVDPPTRAPVPPPTRAPVPPPTRAPVPPPTRAPVPPPTRAPVPPPTRAPVPPPTRAPVPPPTHAPVEPPVEPTIPACKRNIYFIANNNDDFTYLARALRITGLDDVLKDTTATFTVFAPTDAAFVETLGSAHKVEELLGMPGELADILLYHVLENKALFADDIQEKMYTTALGPKVDIFFWNHDIVLDDAAEVISPFDICANNGVIHAIDRVLMPPEDTDTGYRKH